MVLVKYYLLGFSSLILGLRGWGGVASILRKTSSNLGSVSPCLRGFFSVISEPSENQKSKDYKVKAEILLKKATDTFYNNLDDCEYGMPYASETILKTILREMAKLYLITPQTLEIILQFLPKNPEYHGE